MNALPFGIATLTSIGGKVPQILNHLGKQNSNLYILSGKDLLAKMQDTPVKMQKIFINKILKANMNKFISIIH